MRAGVELTSDKVGELAPGSLVHIIEERANADGSKRVCFSLENKLDEYAATHGTHLAGMAAHPARANPPSMPPNVYVLE